MPTAPMSPARASLAGTVQAVFGPGSYFARTYTILSAAGGLGGTRFNSLITATYPPTSPRASATLRPMSS